MRGVNVPYVPVRPYWQVTVVPMVNTRYVLSLDPSVKPNSTAVTVTVLIWFRSCSLAAVSTQLLTGM